MYFTGSPVLSKPIQTLSHGIQVKSLMTVQHISYHLPPRCSIPAELNPLQLSKCPGQPYNFTLLLFRYAACSGTHLYHSEHNQQSLPDSPLQWSPPYTPPLSPPTPPLHKWSILSLNYHLIWHINQLCVRGASAPRGEVALAWNSNMKHSIWHMEEHAHWALPKGGEKNGEWDASLLAWISH